MVFPREFFKRLALCLRDQESREDTGQHEESEDLETSDVEESMFIQVRKTKKISHVLDESIGAAKISELSETNLGDDSSEFAGSGRDTVGR